MAEVVLKNLTKSFGADVGVADISMTIPDGAFVVLLGPTGAGKTTTLRLISGLEKPDAGEVWIGGRNVGTDTPAQRDVAMVFQQYSLYPHLTVRDNLAFPLKSPILNTPADEITRKVAEVAEVLQISHKLDNKATALSGGEMQRVSIGRALVRVELKRIQASLGATLLYVTHDQIEAMTMATHVGVLDEGRLVQFGTPREIYENPNSLYVASRLGLPRINLLPATIFGDVPAGTDQIGLRPEHIIQGQGKPAQVKRVEHLGDQTRLHLDLQGHAITTLAQPERSYEPGAEIMIAPLNPLCFDAQGNRIR